MPDQGPGSNAAPPRLHSLDAYRGFVMLAMASGGLGLAKVAAASAEHGTLDRLAEQFEHASWRGCTAWDLIQPSFMFIVGVAMPFSYAARRARGASRAELFGHAAWRSLVLVALGVFLSSAWSKGTNFTFVNVLAQIGLGYWAVSLLLDRPPAAQWAAALAILVGTWMLFTLYPLPPDAGSIAAQGLDPYSHQPAGFAAHWEKHNNVAAAFDRWFLNLFPRPEPFRINEGGYQTLNFVPSIATMLFGVMAGQWLRTPRPGRAKVFGLTIAGAVSLAAGMALEPYCPIVKRIWTPTWVLYSNAWTCWLLAAFYGAIDVAGWRRWSFPMAVVGMNSIAMYVMAQLMKPWVRGQLRIHANTLLGVIPVDRMLRDRFGLPLGPDPFSGPYGPVVASVSVLFVLWLICLWLYRRAIFVRI